MSLRTLLFAITGLAVTFATSAVWAAYSSVMISADMQQVNVETNVTFNGKNDTLKQTFFVSDVPLQEIPARTDAFNASAEKNQVSGKITSCSSAIDIPGGKNHSYGAFCSLQTGAQIQTVAVCNAMMTSAFKMKQITGSSWSKADLIKFVMNNCVGG